MWVFGYGSLIWNPGFDYRERFIATLSGYHRSFCIRSIHARGTAEKPGLGLALTKLPGAVCRGVAISVALQNIDTVLAYLRERELVSSAYLEVSLDVTLEDGRIVPALTYVANTKHDQFIGDLSAEEQARCIAHAAGDRGPNSEYLYNTVENLDALGIMDGELTQLAQRVRSLRQ
ncbi:MAG TPA: gamma-glutamylcyclotransferase [Bradyrhizobium sp.]|nr:gamma-glutamylcyclotransferase [Bradyrhizobium sp.]